MNAVFSLIESKLLAAAVSAISGVAEQLEFLLQFQVLALLQPRFFQFLELILVKLPQLAVLFRLSLQSFQFLEALAQASVLRGKALTRASFWA